MQQAELTAQVRFRTYHYLKCLERPDSLAMTCAYKDTQQAWEGIPNHNQGKIISQVPVTNTNGLARCKGLF